MPLPFPRSPYALATVLFLIGFFGYWHQTYQTGTYYPPDWRKTRDNIAVHHDWSNALVDDAGRMDILPFPAEEKDPLPDYCDYCGPKDKLCQRYGWVVF